MDDGWMGWPRKARKGSDIQGWEMAGKEQKGRWAITRCGRIVLRGGCMVAWTDGLQADWLETRRRGRREQ